MPPAGDFNLPPDSPMLAPLRRRFRDAFAEAGRGYGYTYPSRLPWVRIDHILAGRHWTIDRCRVGPDLGSDHRPLIAEAVLADPRKPTGHDLISGQIYELTARCDRDRLRIMAAEPRRTPISESLRRAIGRREEP